MRRLASCLSVVGLALAWAASLAAANGGPFAPSGGWAGGGGSGLWGDTGTGPRGTRLGCVDRRRYSDAFGIENRSKVPVTLTAARGANPSPGIVGLVAIQLRLSPPYHPSPLSTGDLVYRRWSAAPTRPVTIPPGRIATVQSNFLLRHCAELTHGRTVVVPGSLVLGYRMPGRAGTQKLTLPANRIVVTRGPTMRRCAPVAGTARLVAADVGCGVARRAAPACHPLSHDGWGDCTVAGASWDCGRTAGPGYPFRETCYLPAVKSHWFSTVWIDGGLGIWGAIQNRTAKEARATHAAPATGGACTVRAASRTLAFRSVALPIERGPAIARIPAVARVELSIRGFRGPGRYAAGGGGVEVAIASHGSYVATGGRVSIVRGKAGSLAGTVYATLRRSSGEKQAYLNGTWSCRTGG